MFVEKTSGPLQFLSWPILEVKKILYYHRTFDEYKKLKEEVNVLKARLIGLEEIIRQNARYEELLKVKRQLIYSSVTANVIGREPSNWNASLIIDKGASDGIRQGMAVVNSLGVVGKIVEVGSRASKVILVTDPQFSVATVIQESRDSGLVSGTLQGNCRLKYLNPNAQVKIGDKVITSSLSSTFPAGLLIGEIIQINEKAGNPSMDYLIQPVVNVSQVEEVLVILR